MTALQRNPVKGLRLISAQNDDLAAGKFGDTVTARVISLYLLIKADLLEEAVRMGREKGLSRDGVAQLAQASRLFASDRAALTKALASDEVHSLETRFDELGIPQPVPERTLSDIRGNLRLLARECRDSKHADDSARLVADSIHANLLPLLDVCLKDGFCYVTDRVALAEGGRLLQRSLDLSGRLPQLAVQAFDVAIGIVSLVEPIVGIGKVGLDAGRFVGRIRDELPPPE